MLLFSSEPGPAAAQPTPSAQVRIDAPLSGEVLQGVVQVTGGNAVEGFLSAEVAFAYQVDPTNTWFLIRQNSEPVAEGSLASWDTTTITDGTYKLRVRVLLPDGQVIDSIVEGLRVRNYSPVETSTPVLTQEAGLTALPAPLATDTPRVEFQVTPHGPEPQPTNPAQVTLRDLQISAIRGSLIVLGLFATAGIYLRLRTRR